MIEISTVYDRPSELESYLHNIPSYPEQDVSSSNTRTPKLTLKLNAHIPLEHIKRSQHGLSEKTLASKA